MRARSEPTRGDVHRFGDGSLGRVEALALDPGDYDGSYKLVGGRTSLDFVNTVSWYSTDRAHDWLDPPQNLIEWALAVGIIDPKTARSLARIVASDPATTGRALIRIRRQRSAIRRALAPLTRGERPRAPDVEELNELLGLCDRSRAIDPERLEWTWELPLRLDEVTRPVIADAADVLVRADHSRLGSCPSCGWLFFDATRNRTRRWCDMADCGSRDKSRRYYYRKIAGGAERDAAR